MSAATIHQDADICRIRLKPGQAVTHKLRPGRGVWLHVAEGVLTLNGVQLTTGDGVSTEEPGTLTLTATQQTEAEIDRLLDRIVGIRGGSREALAGYRQMMTGSLLGHEASARIPHWTARQAYIALGNLLTCAALVGVDACPMEGFVPAEFDNERGVTAVSCFQRLPPEDRYTFVSDEQLPLLRPFKAVVEQKQPCAAYLKAAEGRRLRIGGPEATPDVAGFVQFLQEGQTYNFPEAFSEHRKRQGEER